MKKLFSYIAFLFLITSTVSWAQNETEAYTRAWGTFFGEISMADSYIEIEESAIDDDGSLWVTGSISAHSAQQYFDGLITPDAHQSNYGGGSRDGFLVKFSSEGELLYASYFGGEGNEDSFSIDVKNGKIVLSGYTTSTTNITTEGAYQQELYENLTPNGYTLQDGSFIAQFDTSGQLEWATYYQGNQTSKINHVKKGVQGDVFVWGQTRSTDMGTPGAFKENIPSISETSGGQPPFYPILARFSAQGNLIWATYYAPDITVNNGYQFSALGGLATDEQNNVYVSGITNDDQGYFGTEGVHQTTLGGARDAFIGKFDAMGNRLWGTYFGGPGEEVFTKIEVPYKNNLFISGVTNSSSQIATSGTFQDAYPSGSNNSSFIAKIDFLTGQQVWGSYFGQGSASTTSIAEDQWNNVYVYQATVQTEGLTTPGSFQEENQGGPADGLIAKLDTNGEELLWGSYYGGSGNEFVPYNKALNINELNHIYAVGRTNSGSGNHLLSQNPFQSQGTHFLVKFVPCPEVLAPVISSPQEYQLDMQLEDLEVDFMEWTGSPLIVRWYADADGLEELESSTLVELNQTYYVSQQIQGCPESELASVLISELGLDGYDEDNLKIYPNPTNGKFVIEGLQGASRLTLYNMQGREIYSATTGQPTYTIDLSNRLAGGVYFLEISQNQQKTIRLISIK